MLDGQGVRLGRRRARPQAAGQIDFPGDADAANGNVSIGKCLPLDRVVPGVLMKCATDGANAGHQPGAADRGAGSRRAHAFGGDLDVAVLARGAANQVRQHRIVVALPPGDLGVGFNGGVSRCEPSGHIDGGLKNGSGTPRQRERRGERGRDDAR